MTMVDLPGIERPIRSSGFADVSAVGDTVGVGGAAEEDGSAGWAQPPVRSGGRVQGGVTFEQQSTPAALLGRRLVAGRCELGGGGLDES
jgi:hypothetical protein